jgi:hypothetical protein
MILLIRSHREKLQSRESAMNFRIAMPSMLLAASVCLATAQQPLVYQGTKGPGKGKHIVFVVGDQEYRSEESMPAFARMLAQRHGFKCTVLLPINRESGLVDALTSDNIPGLEALRTANLMVMFTRFQELPDDQMKEILDYTNSGRPIIALRTATHPFNYSKHPENPNAKYSYNSKDPMGGYGRLVFGETWVNHYGAHQKESTRGLPAEGMSGHPILKGVSDVWGESDVYALTTLNGDCKPILMGQVLSAMTPDSPPNPAKHLTPVAWTKTYTGESGKTARIFVTTMGHVADFKSEGFRRMMANGCYWALGMENKIRPKANVDFMGPYNPSLIGMKKHKLVKLDDLR